MTTDDPFDLNRFIEVQKTTYDTALAELRAGQKRSHWMWFIFPQIDGLAFSATSKLYAIKSIEEANAYLAHPILGPRLLACAQAILAVEDRSALAILGTPDDQKLKSCATLFASATPSDPVFEQILEKFYNGERDPRTISMLKA